MLPPEGIHETADRWHHKDTCWLGYSKHAACRLPSCVSIKIIVEFIKRIAAIIVQKAFYLEADFSQGSRGSFKPHDEWILTP